MSTSHWSVAAWRRGPPSTVAVTPQVCGVPGVSDCYSQRSGPSRPDSSPKLHQLSEKGYRRDEQWSAVRTPEGGRARVCAARAHCPNRTGTSQRRSWRNGRKTTGVHERQQNPRPFVFTGAARKEAATNSANGEELILVHQHMVGDFPLGHRRRGRLGRPERGDRCGRGPLLLTTVLNAST